MQLLAKLSLPALLVAALAVNGANGAEPQAPGGGVYSWQQPHAKVLPTGGLEWAPKPFVFEKGASARYIDFAGGDDAKDGKTPQTAWKHHPWDRSAAGEAKACKGIHTYVFKGGVTYRGTLQAAESGAPGDPIRLTRDPGWGEGAALFFGSAPISGGWKRATTAEAPDIPEPEKVWYIDAGKNYETEPAGVKFAAMWQVSGDKVERLHIVRQPGHDVSDPNDPVKNWPVWSAYDRETGTLTSPALQKLGDKDFLKDAIIWTEADFLMASARRMRAEWKYDPEAGSITSPLLANSRWFNRIPKSQVHFMIENVRQFLDAPGEYFFDREGPQPGRLFFRPAEGVDPNRMVYEVSKYRSMISIADQHDIVISGLEFRYNNPDLGTPAGFSISQAQAPPLFSQGEGSTMPCVGITGRCSDITVKNCRFYHVADAVVAGPEVYEERTAASAGGLDNISITDNDVEHVELGGAISIIGESERSPGASFCRLGHAEVLRNRVVNAGFRHGYSPWTSIPAICVTYPETCEVAGNIVDRSFGNGIITYGGKRSGAHNTVPLTRILVHHNQLDNTMLGCNDYGGLEHFQGGPVYIFNNITRNCVGNRTKDHELGYSLYLDGGFKCYCFNNIIAGNVKPDQPDYYNNCGYFMVFGFMDQLFNNTIFHFDNALDGSSGNRSNIVGNLMVDCKLSFIGQNRPGDVSMLAGGDTGAMGRMGIPTMAYASNVFYGKPKSFGIVGSISRSAGDERGPAVRGDTLEELRTALEAAQCRLSSIGWQVSEPPLRDPAQKDYRPTADSGAKGRGVKYFVPWSLARNVGEWNFYKSATKPDVVLGEGFYMTDEYMGRGMYYFIPRQDLTVTACTAEDYAAGTLEDWIDGALVFDGERRVATLTHAEMTRSMQYAGGRRRAPALEYDGSRRETLDMGVNNFLIEVVFKTVAGRDRGTIAGKSGGSGYTLSIGSDGTPRMTLQSGAATATLAGTVKVNDGQWHHVIGEVDRAAGKMTIYVDGKRAGEGRLDPISKDATLTNTADFVVGKGFAGTVDFLRVCRSTLAGSKTSIEELYAWEFNGPALRDFCGNQSEGKRTAGAMEMVGNP